MKNLRHLNIAEIAALIAQWGEKPFRAKQIYEWIWKHGAASIDEMLNLSKDLREKLKQEFTLNAVRIHHTQLSED